MSKKYSYKQYKFDIYKKKIIKQFGKNYIEQLRYNISYGTEFLYENEKELVMADSWQYLMVISIGKGGEISKDKIAVRGIYRLFT